MIREPMTRRVLAIDPFSRGFGFAVLEGPGDLVDWGFRQSRDCTQRASIEKVSQLIRQYQPDVIVVEDCRDPSCRRRQRARSLIRSISALAAELTVEIHNISARNVREVFAGNGRPNKDRIARTVAQHLPRLASKVPPVRKLWMSEDQRMAIFDAAAFALTYYFLITEGA